MMMGDEWQIVISPNMSKHLHGWLMTSWLGN